METSQLESVVDALKRVHDSNRSRSASTINPPRESSPSDDYLVESGSLFVSTAFRLLKDVAIRSKSGGLSQAARPRVDSATRYQRIQGLLRERNRERLRQEFLIDRILETLPATGGSTARDSRVPVQQELRILLADSGCGSGRFLVTNESEERVEVAFVSSPLGVDTRPHAGLDVTFDPPAPELEPGETMAITVRVSPIAGESLRETTVVAVRVLSGDRPMARLWIDLIPPFSLPAKE